MKKITLALATVFSVAAMYSCSNNSGTDTGLNNTESKDPLEVAKDGNDVKDDSNTMAVNEDDSKFLVFAADAGITEIEAAKLALAKPIGPGTKEFANMIIQDHSAVGDEVKSLASKKMVTLPGSLSADHQNSLTDLSDKKDKDFEKAYLRMIVNDHQKVVDEFKDATEKCKDTDVRAFAAKTLPKLQAHLEKAKALKNNLK